jgi:hypothetical protein
MLFNQTKVTALFCLRTAKVFLKLLIAALSLLYSLLKREYNRKFSCCVYASRIQDIQRFPNNDSISISIDLIQKFSPDSLSVMEFKNEIDFHIAEKMFQFHY